MDEIQLQLKPYEIFSGFYHTGGENYLLEAEVADPKNFGIERAVSGEGRIFVKLPLGFVREHMRDFEADIKRVAEEAMRRCRR